MRAAPLLALLLGAGEAFDQVVLGARAHRFQREVLVVDAVG